MFLIQISAVYLSQQKQPNMKTFKQINFKRDYETTNVKFIQCFENPNASIWVECNEAEIDCQQLCIENGNTGRKILFGHL